MPAKSGTGAGFPWSSSRLLDAPFIMPSAATQAALISQGKGGAAPAPETPAAVDHRDDDFSEGGEVILC